MLVHLYCSRTCIYGSEPLGLRSAAAFKVKRGSNLVDSEENNVKVQGLSHAGRFGGGVDVSGRDGFRAERTRRVKDPLAFCSGPIKRPAQICDRHLYLRANTSRIIGARHGGLSFNREGNVCAGVTLLPGHKVYRNPVCSLYRCIL